MFAALTGECAYGSGQMSFWIWLGSFFISFLRLAPNFLSVFQYDRPKSLRYCIGACSSRLYPTCASFICGRSHSSWCENSSGPAVSTQWNRRILHRAPGGSRLRELWNELFVQLSLLLVAERLCILSARRVYYSVSSVADNFSHHSSILPRWSTYTTNCTRFISLMV